MPHPAARGGTVANIVAALFDDFKTADGAWQDFDPVSIPQWRKVPVD